MNYTLKIHWSRFHAESPDHPSAVQDQMDHFIPADEVVAHDYVGADWQEHFKNWEKGDLTCLLDTTHYAEAPDDNTVRFGNGRLIRVVEATSNRWFLVSHAWLLDGHGNTIERLV